MHVQSEDCGDLHTLITVVAGVSHRQIPAQHIVTTRWAEYTKQFPQSSVSGRYQSSAGEGALCSSTVLTTRFIYVSSSRVEWTEVMSSGHFSGFLPWVDCGHTKVLAMETFTIAVALNGFFFPRLRAVPWPQPLLHITLWSLSSSTPPLDTLTPEASLLWTWVISMGACVSTDLVHVAIRTD